MNRPFKREEPFYIGTLNIFNYQATGIRRWNTFLAQLPVAKAIGQEGWPSNG